MNRIKISAVIIASAMLGACTSGGGISNPVASGPKIYQQETTGQQCYDCGTVVDIQQTEYKPTSSGAGILIGAVVGAAAGQEVSNREDRDQGRIAGAAAGAAAGHEIERRKGQYYLIVVRMDNGTTQNVYQRDAPFYGVGERVRVANMK